MVRQDLITSAVTFLQDPSVASSPIEKRVSFLQSKNLTQEEIDAALARAGEDGAAPAGGSSQGPPSDFQYQNQQMTRAPSPGYGQYPGYWQQQQPPDLPRRDWRDWFIMATVVGGIGYGLHVLAKRYVVPLIAPPTPPQVEQDKKNIDESFEKAFALLEQLSTDTEKLKASEQARNDKLDPALQEVEDIMKEVKSVNKRREEDGRRLADQINELKSLIPHALDAHKESTDKRMKELSTELKSLKTLVGNRMGGVSRPSSPAQGDAPNGASGTAVTVPDSSEQTNGVPEPSKPTKTRTPEPTSSASASKKGIPAWQLAAANKSDDEKSQDT